MVEQGRLGQDGGANMGDRLGASRTMLVGMACGKTSGKAMGDTGKIFAVT